jgi:hypothetical protein
MVVATASASSTGSGSSPPPCAYPVVLLESAFGRGATLMIEVRKKR